MFVILRYCICMKVVEPSLLSMDKVRIEINVRVLLAHGLTFSYRQATGEGYYSLLNFIDKTELLLDTCS